MDTLSPETTRFHRVAKVLAFATVIVLIIAFAINMVGRKISHDRQIGSFRSGGWIEENQKTMGLGVDSIEPYSSPMGVTGMATKDSMMADTFDVMQSDGGAPFGIKVIKTGNLSLKVTSIDQAMESLRDVARQAGGDVVNSSLTDSDSISVRPMDAVVKTKSGSATIRVEADRFDETIGNIRALANVVVSESTNGQDVSSEYVDLQARLKNKQTEEEAISAILTRETKQIDDVLQVTIELSRVRGEIEQLQSQMKYLDDQADMATIDVFFTEDAAIGKTDSSWRPSQEIRDAVNALITAFQKLVSFLISFIIVVVPILGVLLIIFGGILYLVVKRLYRWLNR